MDATQKLTSALEAVAHTANLNRAALEHFSVRFARVCAESEQYAADIGEILAALDAWREAGNLFLASIAPPTRPTRCGGICACPSVLHHEMSELSSKLKHAPVVISRTEIINALDDALTRSTEAD